MIDNSTVKRLLFLMCCVLGLNFVSSAQELIVEELQVWVEEGELLRRPTTEEMPKFRGEGIESFCKYLQERVTCPNDDTYGRIVVDFAVDTAGVVRKLRILKTAFDSNIVKGVIESSPKWTPGKNPTNIIFVIAFYCLVPSENREDIINKRKRI